MNPQEPFVPKGRGRGPWRQGQDYKELRRPLGAERAGGPAAQSNSTPIDPGAGGDTKKTASTLSANAKEFYPKGYQPQAIDNSYNPQFEEAPPEGGDCSNYGSSLHQNSIAQAASSHLLETVQQLTLDPGRFDVLIPPLVDTFKIWMSDECTICAIVDITVEQSIAEPNFRYNGARLCSFLNNAEVFDQEDVVLFRRTLLKRCQQEHLTITNNLYSNPGRLRGYVLFVAELFMQLEVTTGYGQRIAVLGVALLEALNLLLTMPAPDNIKCVCQVLKLTGQPLDKQDPSNMSQVIQTLQLITTDPKVQSNIQNLIRSVIELRQREWGEASNLVSYATTMQQQNSSSQNEPVFYGPDGQIMTAEESQFLQESAGKIPDNEDYDEYSEDGEAWVPDDEMDEEVLAAFEQFLQMGRNSSKDNVPGKKSSN